MSKTSEAEHLPEEIPPTTTVEDPGTRIMYMYMDHVHVHV